MVSRSEAGSRDPSPISGRTSSKDQPPVWRYQSLSRVLSVLFPRSDTPVVLVLRPSGIVEGDCLYPPLPSLSFSPLAYSVDLVGFAGTCILSLFIPTPSPRAFPGVSSIWQLGLRSGIWTSVGIGWH